MVGGSIGLYDWRRPEKTTANGNLVAASGGPWLAASSGCALGGSMLNM